MRLLPRMPGCDIPKCHSTLTSLNHSEQTNRSVSSQNAVWKMDELLCFCCGQDTAATCEECCDAEEEEAVKESSQRTKLATQSTAQGKPRSRVKRDSQAPDIHYIQHLGSHHCSTMLHVHSPHQTTHLQSTLY